MSLASDKILRVALIQGAKITEERHLRKHGHVTMGEDARNTFVVPGAGLPDSFQVFEYRGGQYHLQFRDDMTGRVHRNDRDLTLEELRKDVGATRRGALTTVPLTDAARGKVSIGEVTLLFQFVVAPAEPVQPSLPREIRGSIWTSLDHFFMGVLAVSLILHFFGATLLALSPRPPEEDLALDELPDRFAKVMIPVQPDAPPEQKTDEPKREHREDHAKKVDHKEADPVARRAAIQKKVAGKGLLRVLGSSGPGGALQDVLGDSTGAGDIASAIQGAAGVAVADASSVGGPKGGGSGKTAGIGDLGTAGGGNVNLGNKHDAKVVGHVREETPDVDSADVDREALARYVKARLKAIQSCYERELKRNPTLHGKVLVRFSITRLGRAGSVEIEENSLNEGVASCIKTVIRGWVFPFKPGDDVPVSYPFVFSPSSG